MLTGYKNHYCLSLSSKTSGSYRFDYVPRLNVWETQLKHFQDKLDKNHLNRPTLFSSIAMHMGNMDFSKLHKYRFFLFIIENFISSFQTACRVLKVLTESNRETFL